MKRVRLTALAEFDLVEAQNFYAPNGAWVLDHFMENIVLSVLPSADMTPPGELRTCARSPRAPLRFSPMRIEFWNRYSLRIDKWARAS